MSEEEIAARQQLQEVYEAVQAENDAALVGAP